MRSGAGGGLRPVEPLSLVPPGGHTIRTTAVTIASVARTITITGQLFHQPDDGRACVTGILPVGRGGRIGCEVTIRAIGGLRTCAACGAGCGASGGAWPAYGM